MVQENNSSNLRYMTKELSTRVFGKLRGWEYDLDGIPLGKDMEMYILTLDGEVRRVKITSFLEPSRELHTLPDGRLAPVMYRNVLIEPSNIIELDIVCWRFV